MKEELDEAILEELAKTVEEIRRGENNVGNVPWGKPECPPPPQKYGPSITRFIGWVTRDMTNRKGQLELTVVVPPQDKYKATLATDVQGMMLYFEVYEPPMDEPEGEPFVWDGEKEVK